MPKKKEKEEFEEEYKILMKYNEGIPKYYQLNIFDCYLASQMLEEDPDNILEAFSFLYQLGFKAGEKHAKNEAKKRKKKKELQE